MATMLEEINLYFCLFVFLKKEALKLSSHAGLNPYTWEAKTENCHKFESSLGYLVRQLSEVESH